MRLFSALRVISLVRTKICSLSMANPTKNDTSSAAGKTRVLMIDDDRKLCRLVRDYLEPMGYAIDAAHTGPDGLEKAQSENFHAIILDLMLPGMDGFEVLKKLRHTSDIPVLMLTARGEEPDRIVGLEIGADDYLPKTFSTRELLARLRAVTRRGTQKAKSSEVAPEEIVIGALRVRPESRVAILNDQALVLTPGQNARATSRSHGRPQLRRF
jgi:DNA-binding response OmpR family regulator